MLVYAAVLVTAAGLGWLVIRYDLYDREPWWLLAATFAVAFVAMRACGHLEDAIFRSAFDGFPTTWAMALVAAVVEESGKVAIVAAVALLVPRHFNDPMDGLVYGAFAGLGMAVEESFHYLSFSELDARTLGAETVRLLAHHLLGAIGGFAIGMARVRARGWKPALVAGFGTSLVLHTLWDRISGAQLETITTTDFQRLAAIGLMLTAMGVFAALVVIGSRQSREYFAGARADGLDRRGGERSDGAARRG